MSSEVWIAAGFQVRRKLTLMAKLKGSPKLAITKNRYQESYLKSLDHWGEQGGGMNFTASSVAAKAYWCSSSAGCPDEIPVVLDLVYDYPSGEEDQSTVWVAESLTLSLRT